MKCRSKATLIVLRCRFRMLDVNRIRLRVRVLPIVIRLLIRRVFRIRLQLRFILFDVMTLLRPGLVSEV